MNHWLVGWILGRVLGRILDFDSCSQKGSGKDFGLGYFHSGEGFSLGLSKGSPKIFCSGSRKYFRLGSRKDSQKDFSPGSPKGFCVDC